MREVTANNFMEKRDIDDDDDDKNNNISSHFRMSDLQFTLSQRNFPSDKHVWKQQVLCQIIIATFKIKILVRIHLSDSYSNMHRSVSYFAQPQYLLVERKDRNIR